MAIRYYLVNCRMDIGDVKVQVYAPLHEVKVFTSASSD